MCDELQRYRSIATFYQGKLQLPSFFRHFSLNATNWFPGSAWEPNELPALPAEAFDPATIREAEPVLSQAGAWERVSFGGDRREVSRFFGPSVAIFWCLSVSAFAVEGTPVRLGGDSLTNGIPGSGTLKLVEIEAWLDKPEHHKTLEEVVDFYNKGGGNGLGFKLENQTLPADKLNLTSQEKQDLVAFMRALTDAKFEKNMIIVKK